MIVEEILSNDRGRQSFYEFLFNSGGGHEIAAMIAVGLTGLTVVLLIILLAVFLIAWQGVLGALVFLLIAPAYLAWRWRQYRLQNRARSH